MSKYQQFVFEDYRFDEQSKTLELNYSFGGQLKFTESYKFNFEFINYNPAALDQALQHLFFVAGVSYYKTYLAPDIVVNAGEIDQELSEFLSQTYERGLGEFFFMNKFDPKTRITFPTNCKRVDTIDSGNQTGLLIGLGGGKDSLVTVELLRDQPKVATWSLNHASQLQPLVERVGLKHFMVERTWDQQLKQLNSEGALNGHVPISAIFSCVGTVVGILTGYRDNIVSNESSASEPTMTYQGVDINHQYSKSLAYETSYQRVLECSFGHSSRYYSFLRPLSELRIAELFAKIGFDKYNDVFSSCNRAYTHDQNQMSWCGECAKCAFVFLVLTPFIERSQLETLWGGKNLLLDPALHETYTQLLGTSGDKPFDCVGEIKESRAAMRLAQTKYPELNIYKFDLILDYDFRASSRHAIPPEMFVVLGAKII